METNLCELTNGNGKRQKMRVNPVEERFYAQILTYESENHEDCLIYVKGMHRLLFNLEAIHNMESC